jgi:hypothetical protein
MTLPLDELNEIASGPMGRVLVTDRCLKELESATLKARAQIPKSAEKAVTYGFNELPSEKFKFETRFRLGGSKGRDEALYAFKAWKLRVYGILVDHGGSKTFIGTLAAEKKQNKARKHELETAAKRCEELWKGRGV